MTADGSMTTVSLTRLADVEPERVSWLWPGYIPLGKLVTIDGDPGLGKSTVAVDIGATTTKGGIWPDGTACTSAGAVLVMSAEDGIADTVRPRFDAAGADVAKVYAVEGVPVIHDDGTRTLRVPTLADITGLADAIAETGARLLIVDVVMAYLPTGSDAHKDQDIRRVLSPLSKLADDAGCTVLLLRHLNKAAGRDPLYRGGGSIGIVGAARAGLVVARDPEDGDRRVLASVKSNLGPAPGALAYRLADAPEHGCARVQWEGAVSHTAKTLLTDPDRDDDHDARTEAEQWLADYLIEQGTSPSADAKKAAAKVGIAERTLKRAAKAIKVATESRGFPRVTYWSLHSETNPVATTAAVQGPGPPGPTGPDQHERNGPTDSIPQSGQLPTNGPTGRPAAASAETRPSTPTPLDEHAKRRQGQRERQRTHGKYRPYQSIDMHPCCIVCGNPVIAGQGDTHLSCKTGAAS
jgi:AAA domain